MNIRISRNRDGTITVRVNRMIEHIDPASKTHLQIFDAVKYALISKGASLSDDQIAERLYQLRA